MRKSKAIVWYLPELLCCELDKYLKDNQPNFGYKMEYFYYIIHVLTDLSNKYKEYEYYILKKLKNITVSNIERYIRILENGGFIISDNKYNAGEKKCWYKINTNYEKGVKIIEVAPGTRLYKNIRKLHYNIKAHDNRLKPFLKRMKDEFYKMDMNYDEAKKWITDNAGEDKKYIYLTSINSIQDEKSRYFGRNKTNNRLDTNLTNLKSDFRQFIIGDYVSLDLQNSQPFFLSLLINQIITELRKKKEVTENINSINSMNNINKMITYPLCCHFLNFNIAETFGIRAIQRISKFHQKTKIADMVELRRFSDTTKSGIFYDAFALSHPGNVNRDKIKDIMFKVLFSSNEQHPNCKRFIPFEKEKAIFKNVYPFIYEVITILKEKDHTKLAIALQKMESLIFIDHISKELVNKGIVPLTIHDSILIHPEQQEQAVKTIKSVFKEHCGVVPSFHIKNIKSNE